MLYKLTWACNCASLCRSQSCGIYGEWAEVSWTNIQRIKLLATARASAFYKVLGYPCKKNVFVYHLWQLLGSNHLQAVFIGNLFQGKHTPRTWRHEGSLPQSTGNRALLQFRSSRRPCCWTSRQLWEARKHERCEFQQFVFEVRSNIRGTKTWGFNQFGFLSLEMYPAVYMDTVYVDSNAL